MARIYAKGEGMAITIAGYGRATDETPAIVPTEVADELHDDKEVRSRIRIKWDDGEDPKSRREQAQGDGVLASDVFHPADAEANGEPLTVELLAPGARGEE